MHYTKKRERDREREGEGGRCRDFFKFTHNVSTFYEVTFEMSNIKPLRE